MKNILKKSKIFHLILLCLIIGQGYTYAQAPILSGINKQETCDGQSILNIPITVTGDTIGLTFSTLSSNLSITPTFTFFGPATARKMNITTTSGQIGATTIRVIATNNTGGKDTTAFQLELGNKTFGSSVLGPETVVISPFNSLSSFAFGLDNKIYCTVGNAPPSPYTAGTVAQFSLSGALLNATYISGLTSPARLTIGKDGKLYFINNGASNLTRYNGTTFEANKAIAAQSVISIQTNSAAEVFYQNFAAGGGILKLPANYSNASPITNLYTTNPNPNFMIMDPSETFLYYLDSSGFNNSKLIRLNIDGSGSTLILATPKMRGLAFDENGNLWISHGPAGKLSLVNLTNGTFTEFISSGFYFNPVFKNGEIYYLNSSGSTAGVYKRSYVIPVTYSACNAKPTFNPTSLANDPNRCFSNTNIALPNRIVTVSDLDGTIVSTVVSSSNPSLIGVTNTGTATNVVLSLTQFANQSGSATIKVVSTDNLGAKDSISFMITVNQVLVSTTTQTNVACFGQSTGSATLNASGGTAPYTYQWTLGGAPIGTNTSSLSSLSAGTYLVTVTDAQSCSTNHSVTINQSSAIIASNTTTNVACFGGSDGAINLSVTGGVAPYSYSWTSGPTSEDRTNLTAGTYIVTITDGNSCQVSSSATVTQPNSAVSGAILVSDVLCNGSNTGYLDLAPTGGTPGYTFDWGSGITTEDRSAVPAGTYSVSIVDANGCSTVVNTTVTEPTAISSNIIATNIDCNGAATGAIDILISGGVGPYSTAWSNGQSSEDLSGLTAGTYTVTIYDDNACVANTSVTLTENTSILIGSTTTDVACNGSATGAIDITVTGGTAPYSFDWGGGITSEDQINLSAGSYTLAVTDVLGCNAILTTVITEPAAIVSSLTQTVCDSSTLNGQTFTTSGVFTQNLTAINGCDSTLTFDLTVNYSVYDTLTTDACSLFQYNGMSYDSSGVYLTTSSLANGCSRYTTLNITINETPTITATDNGDLTLSASAYDHYQWFDCQTGQHLVGDTLQTLTLTDNGIFGVIGITSDGCSDTSECVVIGNANLSDLSTIDVSIAPNPSNDVVTISFNALIAELIIRDAQGKLIESRRVSTGDIISLAHLNTGVYFFEIATEAGMTIKRIIKN